MEAIRKQIEEWKSGLLSPNQNDVLLNIKPDKNALAIEDWYNEEKLFTVPDHAFLKKCDKQHRNAIKESGTPIFGLAKDQLCFTIDHQQYQMPFLLASATLLFNRFNSLFEIEQTEDFYVNPLLLNLLNIEDIASDSNTALQTLEALGLKVQFENGVWAANFHPHRFVIQKELDALSDLPQYNNALRSLFGEQNESADISLSDSYLFPADASQQLAIETVKKENTVVQGPPGTGKSQVIANLIGKVLGKEKNALIVAEKSVALQVIYDLLKQKDLHHFCVLYHHELKAKQFVTSLKNTWKTLESIPKQNVSVNVKHELLLSGLDLKFKRLQQKDLIGGISFNEFKTEFKALQSVKYVEQKPTIPKWKKELESLKQLEVNGFPIYGSWLYLKTEQFTIADIQKSLQKLREKCNQFDLEKYSPKQIEQRSKLSLLNSLFFHDDNALPISIFEANSKTQKKLLKHYHLLKTLLEKKEVLVAEEKLWKKQFSLTELQEYIEVLSSKSRFNFKSWRVKNKLSKYTHLDIGDTKNALENLVELTDIKRKIITQKEGLRKLDLPDELPVLEHIVYAIKRINSADQNAVQQLFEFTEKERLTLKSQNQDLNEVQQLIRYYFQFDDAPIGKQIGELNEELPLIIENNTRLKQISIATKNILSSVSTLAEAEHIIYNSHWKDFKGQFPDLGETTGKDIQATLNSIIEAESLASDEFSNSITQRIKQGFEEYHQLLQTPASKLKPEQKELKKTLRKGKSILVKAFDKKRVFPSVRELLESEARLWVQLLHPVFLCSPYSVAKSLPLDFSFDLNIFDEASQIPLNHIVGAVQRSKRVVISGDQQQMAPQFYFQKKTQHQMEALHHASFYWKNVMLTHHYRSKHPRLIEFSNRYFYENKLRTFPTLNPEIPIEVITTKGVFTERKNEEEAEIAAKIITTKIINNTFDFGLVAFSQTQLQAILDKIPAKERDQLTQHDFIFVQSLENVQGDQCEHLIISLGYGKNENGDFHMRFGPLNKEQGHRRLNVLMSRAVSKTTFIRSVEAKDFAISDNEGVESLRKLMLFLEEEERTLKNTHFPEGVRNNGDMLEIKNVSNTFKDAKTALDFYRTMIDRDWKVEIGI